MITFTIEHAARARFAAPVVIVLAAIVIIVNEGTYQNTTGTLRRGIALTDARIEAARTLQTVTELEASARAVLSSRDAADRERFESVARTLPQRTDQVLALVAQVDTQGEIGSAKVRDLVIEQASRWRAWVEAAAASASTGASVQLANSHDSRIRIAALSAEFEDVLARAAGTQERARTSLYQAFQLNRFAIHGLVLLACLALWMFARQLRRFDEQRAKETSRLKEQLVIHTAQLRDLATHLVTVREDERNHLARELHDEMGGLMTAMKLELARMRRVEALPAGAIQGMSGIDKRLNEGIALKRRIVENLRPSSLDQLGLVAALEMLCTETAAVSGLKFDLQLEPVALNNDAELSLYRVVQESLTNVMKYAQAKRVSVSLSSDQGLVSLTVKDDGKGFVPESVGIGRHGLAGMRLRIESHGGVLRVDSQPGQGTTLVATVPC